MLDTLSVGAGFVTQLVEGRYVSGLGELGLQVEDQLLLNDEGYKLVGCLGHLSDVKSSSGIL